MVKSIWCVFEGDLGGGFATYGIGGFMVSKHLS